MPLGRRGARVIPNALLMPISTESTVKGHLHIEIHEHHPHASGGSSWRAMDCLPTILI